MGQYGKLGAISLLAEGKTDSELLVALVTALLDNDSDIIDKLTTASNYDQRTATNVRIVAAIAEVVQEKITKSVEG